MGSAGAAAGGVVAAVAAAGFGRERGVAGLAAAGAAVAAGAVVLAAGAGRGAGLAAGRLGLAALAALMRARMRTSSRFRTRRISFDRIRTTFPPDGQKGQISAFGGSLPPISP